MKNRPDQILKVSQPRKGSSYLPILGVPLQHQRVFRLADLPIFTIFNFFNILLRLYPLILGESTMMSLLELTLEEKKARNLVNLIKKNALSMTYPSCMRQEVRSNRLEVARCGRREGTNHFEILFCCPALR